MNDEPLEGFVDINKLTPAQWAIIDQNQASVRNWVQRRLDEMDKYLQPDRMGIATQAAQAISALDINELETAIGYLLRRLWELERGV